jgi:serine/threonine protein kinase
MTDQQPSEPQALTEAPDPQQFTGPFADSPDETPNVETDRGDRRAPPGYQILGTLGRGGMGVVFQARQVKANRLVALKMMLSGNNASDAERQRFQIEAEAVAKLDHPNIVIVYDVGEFDGLPYFAMEYCAGGSLASVLKDHPLPARQAAEVIRQLALGVAHAHSQGVLHRDLKPANVLLLTHSRTPDRSSQGGSATKPTGSATGPSEAKPTVLLPKITDFGLAKRIEADSGQTRTDAILGTPSYMSPEQAFGATKYATTAVDVYSLGAILYDCLTGRAPFKGATVLETLDQVRYQEPVPPRQLNPHIPRDLETICLKCLQKDPARRYASAQDLADECSRFLEGQPILARPIGSMEKVIRWCRRKPLVAGLAVVSLLLAFSFVGSLIASTLVLSQKNSDIEQKQSLIEGRNAELAAANDSLLRERAALTRQSSLNAEQVRYLMRNVMGELKTLGLVRTREKLIQYVQQSLDRLERLTAEDQGMTARVRIASHVDTGSLCLELSASEPNLAVELRARAEQNYRQAISLARTLAQQLPESDLARGNLALCLARLGQLKHQMNDKYEARRLFEESLRLRDDIVHHPKSKPGVRDYLFPADALASLAESHEILFELSVAEANSEQAAQHWKQFRDLQDRALKMVESDPKTTEDLAGVVVFQKNVARGLMREAALALAQKKTKEAVQLLEKAVALRDQVVADNADSMSYKEELASTFFKLGIAHLNARQYDKARDSFERMFLLFDQVVKQGDEAKSRDQRWTLGLSLYGLGFTEAKLGHKEKSRQAYRDCLYIREGLWREDTRPRHGWGLMGAYARCGMERRALEVLKAEEERMPQPIDFYFNATTVYSVLAEQVGEGQPDQKLSPEDAKRRDDHIESAWRFAEKLKQAGSRRVIELATDPDLEFLQSRPDFKKRLEELGMAGKP